MRIFDLSPVKALCDELSVEFLCGEKLILEEYLLRNLRIRLVPAHGVQSLEREL